MQGPDRLRYPAFSPDGAFVAYLASSQGSYHRTVLYFTDLKTLKGYAIAFPGGPVNASNVPNGPLSRRK